MDPIIWISGGIIAVAVIFGLVVSLTPRRPASRGDGSTRRPGSVGVTLIRTVDDLGRERAGVLLESELADNAARDQIARFRAVFASGPPAPANSPN